MKVRLPPFARIFDFFRSEVTKKSHWLVETIVVNNGYYFCNTMGIIFVTQWVLFL